MSVLPIPSPLRANVDGNGWAYSYGHSVTGDGVGMGNVSYAYRRGVSTIYGKTRVTQLFGRVNYTSWQGYYSARVRRSWWTVTGALTNANGDGVVIHALIRCY